MTQQEGVLLVHGLWMHGAVMLLLHRHIARFGYSVARFSYPSVRFTLTQNADRLAAHCAKLDFRKLHLVGHSLGGLVILCMLERAVGLRVGRIVLAGTPYGGSYAARRLERLPGGRALLGHSVPEWLARTDRARAPTHEIGVIAGNVSAGLGRLVAPALPLPNDGVVAVDETRIPGMRDHIVIPINHSGMLLSAAVARQICEFLRHGAFARVREARLRPTP
jgi:pimeloyl-ACP methyl ester carboxylesterase